MKKRLLVSSMCLCMTMGLCACGGDSSSSTEVTVDGSDSVTTEATDTENEISSETTEATPTADLEWEVIDEETYTFPSNIIGYYDDDYVLSVGPSGEIHYKSSDAPDWPLSDNVSLCRFGMDIIDGQTMYTCGAGGMVTKSTDGGKTFEVKKEFGDYNSNYCKLMSFCDVDNGIIASLTRLAITSDGANTWTELECPCDIITIYMIDTKNFFIIGTDYKLYSTTDGGTTWNSTPLNLPGGTNYNNDIITFALHMDDSSNGSIFCYDKETKLLKNYTTTDGFATCTEHAIPELKYSIGTLFLNHDGSVLTYTDGLHKTLTAIKKK